MSRFLRFRFLCGFAAVLFVTVSGWAEVDPEKMAREVTIHRDEWGVPHIHGTTDPATVFGSAYAQCEDYFWQVEETYISSLGRQAEVNGESGVQNDMKIALFDVIEQSRRDFETIPKYIQDICEAFAAGYNYYLAKNPDTNVRLLHKMEPFHVLVYERSMILGRLLGHAHAPQSKLKPLLEEVRAATGSNQWAVGPSKTKDGTTMLFVNPHQPWFGTGMFTELHVKSDSGWNFSGSTFPGGPFPTMGHNDYLGWAYTVNQPDIGDVYRLTFDHPTDKLKYRYGDGWKTAVEWKNTLKVLVNGKLEEREYTFRRSHYGPIMGKEDDTHYLAVKVSKLFDGSRMVQAMAQTKSRNFEEWSAAAGLLNLQMFNTMYADMDGNIFYLYNGTIAKKDPSVDWRNPVDGSDPKNEWGDFYTIWELPNVLNPQSDFMQNCNSTPFTTTDDGNPSPADYATHMVEDSTMDMRRAKMSRHLLRNAEDLTFEDWQELAYDTTLYWPMTELPRYKQEHERLKVANPSLAEKVAPYLEHLSDWDYKSTVDSTETTLAVSWFENLYGRSYPGEVLKPQYKTSIPARFEALISAADGLEKTFGSWKVPYGDVHRLQRHADQAGLYSVPFSDDLPSLPQVGVRGPLGVAFTVYHTPSTPERKYRYAGVGASFMAVYEFGEKVKAKTYLHFGQSGVADSPHFFDQAELLSKKQFKPGWFHWDDVLEHTEAAYHPGEPSGDV